MGIPESPYSRDFGDPVAIIGTPFCRRLAVWNDTDGRFSVLSTTICATNSTQKDRQSPWVLPKEVTTIPTQGDFNSTANCIVFSVYAHRTCFVHQSL